MRQWQHGDRACERIGPFHHVVIDGFLDPWVARECARELHAEAVLSSWWKHDEHQHQTGKGWIDDPGLLPPCSATTLRWFNSPETVDLIGRIMGISELVPDPAYLGGGVHLMRPGGHLGMHADFNLHPGVMTSAGPGPMKGMHRRVNALLFLNPGWDPDWGGELVLGNPALRGYFPIHNRLVVMRIDDDAIHGVPDPIRCPSDELRISLALYYYTADRPEHEKAPFHWATWQES